MRPPGSPVTFPSLTGRFAGESDARVPELEAGAGHLPPLMAGNGPGRTSVAGNAA